MRGAVLAGAFLAVAAGPVGAQPFFGEEPPPDIPPVNAEPTPTLFVPVKPGEVVATPVPAPGPMATPTLFVPSDIPAPAIQATGETIDLIPEPQAAPVSSTPVLQPYQPTPGFPAVPQPTPQPFRSLPAQAVEPKPTPTPRKRPAPPPAPTAVSQQQINSWVSQATEKRDPNLATQIGWAYFNRNEYSSAGVWFNQALEWNSNLGEAAYGLALCKFREGDISSAEAIANYRAGSYPKMKTLQGDIYSRRGTEAYEMKEYQESLNQFNKAAAARPLSRNEQIIVAWDYYYLKQYEKSAQLFEGLYQRVPDDVSAQGLYASLTKLKQYDRMDAVSNRTGGPLKKVYRTYDSRRYYEANLFLASADSGGAKVYKVLQNLNTPSIAAGFSYRSKSGTEGEGQLQAVTIPAFQAQVFPANKFMLSAALSHLNLESGDLPNGAQVGNVPETFTPYSYDANTSENDLWEWAVRLEYQDWLSWYVTFGSTPLNGPLQAQLTGNAGVIYRDVKGYFQGEIYSRSIKESILSWVGSVDPYTGQKWGRVTETGISGSIFRSIGEDNTIFLKGGYGTIMGTNVADNSHYYGTVAVSHIYDMPGFEYVTLGVALSGEAFDNNQNHFTYGNGGYFSPEYLVQGLVQAQFLTEEGQKWIAAGSAGAGLQNNNQPASPYFPLNDDGQEFDSVESTTGIGLIQMQGAYLIDGNWLVGGSFNYAVTADYNEGSISLWVRYFFERRNGLLRTDLLGFDLYR